MSKLDRRNLLESAGASTLGIAFVSFSGYHMSSTFVADAETRK